MMEELRSINRRVNISYKELIRFNDFSALFVIVSFIASDKLPVYFVVPPP